MPEKYDPVPDLALLLDAARRAGWSALPYVDRLTEGLGLGLSAGPEATEAAEGLLREALGLKACRCVLGGGDLIPLACPVHGTPCEGCGGLESCTEDCGEAAPEDGDYLRVDDGTDSRGLGWEVGSLGPRLIVSLSPLSGWQLDLEDGERDRFAEAVARAVTPARVPVKHGPGCHCTPCLAEPSYRGRGQVTS
jgi:hypothetical protein